MKRVRFLVLLLVVIALLSFAPAQTAKPAARRAVVVELFTSEGCSSCPPADALLGRLRQEKLAEGVEVIPMGLHVDYWNHQGWIDRFSSAAYTDRQIKYAEKLHVPDPYTPQMVVDGSVQFTGNDAPRARQAILQEALRPAVAEVQITPAGEGKFQITVKAGPESTGDVLLAITEDNLVSKVSAGENSNHELHHSAVVREFKSLGHLRNGGFSAPARVKLNKDSERDHPPTAYFFPPTASLPSPHSPTLPLC